MATNNRKGKKPVGTSTTGRKKLGEYDKLNAEIQQVLDGAAKSKKVGETMGNSGEIVIVDAQFRRGDAGAEYCRLIQTLLDWVSSELSSDRIIVRSLEEDFCDGLLLAKLVDKLYSVPNLQAIPEIIPSEAGQKQRIRVVLQTISDQMQIPEEYQDQLPWSVDLIYERNEVALVRLLMALARHSGAAVRLPDSLPVQLVIVQRLEGGVLQTLRKELDLAVPFEFIFTRGEADAFDTLFEQTPEKIPQVTQALCIWLNNHLGRLGFVVNDLLQLADGAYLVMLVGLLEGFFVPLHEYHVAPRAVDERSANVRLAIALLTDAGVDLPVQVRSADIVNGDLRSIVRFIYYVFQLYSNRERERAYAATLVERNETDSNYADYADPDAEGVNYDDQQAFEFLPPPEPYELSSEEP